MKPALPLATALSTILAACLLLGQATAYADTTQSASTDGKEREKYESGGVLTGMAVGALAGGPVGAILSAAAGGWFGNVLHEAKAGKHLRRELVESQEQIVALQDSNAQLQQRNMALGKQVQQTNQLASTNSTGLQIPACCADSVVTLHFRSASVDIESHYQEVLQEFATIAKAYPDVTVEISGHADRRGEDAANLALSQQRVQAVESALRKLGLQKTHFVTSARGELQPMSAEDSVESNFFDRRVQIRLRSDRSTAGASGDLLSQSRR